MSAPERKPRVGDVQRDRRGVWVVVGVQSESGATDVSRVRVGSLAHRTLAASDPRIAAVPLDPLLQP
jgi:hypothetical protein